MLRPSQFIRRLENISAGAVCRRPTTSQPLLFLYPRWFASATAALPCKPPLDTSPEQIPRAASRDEHESSVSNHGVLELAGQESISPTSVQTVTNVVPTQHLVRRLRVKKEYHLKILKRERDLQEQRHIDSPDWRECLKTLELWTPHGISHGKQTRHVCINDIIADVYRWDIGELFLNILLSTDCHVQLVPEFALSQSDATFLSLTGTEEAIERAFAQLKTDFDSTAWHEVKQPSLEKVPEESNIDGKKIKQEPLRAVWSRSSRRENHDYRRHIEDVVQPEQWSTIAFANYIDDLVYSWPPRQRAIDVRRTYNDSNIVAKSHRKETAKTIAGLFQNADLAPYITTSSCAAAFSYLARHRRFPEIRQIFDALETNKARLSATTLFNRLIKAAADAQDLHNWRFLLNIMLKRGARPNWETWAGLVHLCAYKSTEDARVIVDTMWNRSLLDGFAARMSVAEALVRHDFEQWIDRDYNVAEFFKFYDSLWKGPEWSSIECFNRMLNVAASKGRHADAEAVLCEMDRRGRKPNVVTLNTLLSGAADVGGWPVAITFMCRIVRGPHHINPDEVTFHLLSRLAWDRRCYNLWRVVWRYSCMSGHVTFAMRMRMKRSITRQLSHPVPGRTQSMKAKGKGSASSWDETFRHNAARISLGLSPSTREYNAEVFKQTERHLLLRSGQDTASETTSSSSAYMLRLRLLGLVDNDTHAYGKLEPIVPLSEKLSQAWELDKQWHAQGRRDDLEAMLKEAVAVPVGTRGEADRRHAFMS